MNLSQKKSTATNAPQKKRRRLSDDGDETVDAAGALVD
jgi:hypothetical protein